MATKKKSKDKDEAPEFEAPQVNILDQGRQAMTLAGEAYPYFLNLNRQYGAAYAKTEAETAGARNAAEQQVIQQQGAGLRESLLGASPEISAANQSVMDRLKETGPSALETEMNRQALTDLKLGGGLSAEESRLAIQTARAGSSARGLAQGQAGTLAEILTRQQFADSRQETRRGFASAVDSQTTQRRASDAAISNNAFNTLGSFWDPQQRIFGAGGSAVSGQVTGPNAFASYLGPAVNVAQGNQAAALAEQQSIQDNYWNNVNREDSRYYSEQNRADSNANAASARRSATKSAGWKAAGTILGAVALAFL